MTQHDAETLRLGRENIARIRAQLGVTSKNNTDAEPSPPTAEPDPPAGDLTIDRIQIEMAAAEERDQMKATIARLEERVAQLEATLAAVVRTAASGIESRPSTTSVSAEGAEPS
jgi:hypothetical protein